MRSWTASHVKPWNARKKKPNVAWAGSSSSGLSCEEKEREVLFDHKMNSKP